MKTYYPKFWMIVAVLAIISGTISAQTNVSGYILTNTAWTLAGSPYIVTGNTLVNYGVTLTIEPEVMVRFDATKTLQIDGELIAIGTAQSRITFTATDSSSSWGRIQFSDGATDAVFDTAGNYVSGSILKYCDIRYARGLGAVNCNAAAPYFSHCRISDCGTAIYFLNAVGRVDSSSIRNCGYAMYFGSLQHPADLIVKNDTFEYNNAGGIIRSDNSTFTNFTVNNCVFSNNGNSIYAGCSGNSVITNNIFNANVGAIAGPLGVNVTISDNVFTAHTVGVIGFTITCSYLTFLTANNLTIANNYFEDNKGGIFTTATYSVLQGNTFLNNQFIVVPSGDCSGIGASIGFMSISGQGLMINNVIEGTTNTYSIGWLITIQGDWEIANNIIKNNSRGNFYCPFSTPNICSNKFVNNSGEIIISFTSIHFDYASFFHHNEFLNNAGSGTIIDVQNSSNSIVNNNEFRDNTGTGNPMLSVSTATVSNNRFVNNLASGNPIVFALGSTFHNNDFLNNTGFSCLRILSLSAITQNNFVNPNVQYEIENQNSFGLGANLDVSNNYWGTTNTAHIDSVIKDYFDDANLSVALYPPVLAAPAFVDTNAACSTTVCALSVGGTVVNVSCYGGSDASINITVANGTNPYTYVWSSGASTEDISGRASGSYTVTVIDANFCSATKSFLVGQPASPVSVVSGVVTNANCNTGGSINISAGGGTSPYTYNWGSGITTQNRTGLNTGNYSVTVRDNNNCSATQSFTVGQDAGPTISGTVTNTSCNNGCDGAINLSATGIAPYTYDWGNGFGTSEDTSGLCAGTYNVTVADSNNCGIAATFTIASPVAMNTTASVASDVSCFGYSDGAATIAVSGGTSPYNYLWSDGQTAPTATALSAGTYDVTVTDSLGCTASASVTLPDGYDVFAGAIIGFNSAEIGQPALFSVNASSAYAYNWSVNNGIIVSGQGSNTIEVAWTAAGSGLVELIASEQGCADTVSKSVTVIDTTRNCSAIFHLYPDIIPHSYFVINTASGISQLSYSWNWGDGSPADTTAYPSHTYSAAGFYTICLTITDFAGCTDTYCNPYFLFKTEDQLSAMITVNVYPPTFTGVRAATLENIQLYPNPTDASVTLKTTGAKGPATLKLLDTMGKEILHQSSASYQLEQGVTIDLSTVSQGLYFLRIQLDEETRYIKIIRR